MALQSPILYYDPSRLIRLVILGGYLNGFMEVLNCSVHAWV